MTAIGPAGRVPLDDDPGGEVDRVGDLIDGEGEDEVAEGVPLAPHLGRRRGDLQPVGDQALIAVPLGRDDHQPLAQIVDPARVVVAEVLVDEVGGPADPLPGHAPGGRAAPAARSRSSPVLGHRFPSTPRSRLILARARATSASRLPPVAAPTASPVAAPAPRGSSVRLRRSRPSSAGRRPDRRSSPSPRRRRRGRSRSGCARSCGRLKRASKVHHALAEIDLEPGVEVHRRVRRGQADVGHVAEDVAGRDVERAAEGDREVREVAAHAAAGDVDVDRRRLRRALEQPVADFAWIQSQTAWTRAQPGGVCPKRCQATCESVSVWQ